uniref:F-box domain and ankyrin repeat protein n=1 Tax=Pithovirus LCPAC302 TaxID=2506593 RepID=A0A481Z7P1_9VIRU|nr:MAG: F-box domain and ankyrin repeat protein [Pithovirus LCPAC302]
MEQRLNILPKDIIQSLAMTLELPEILVLCRTSKRFNQLICDNKNFWINRVIQDFNVDIPKGKDIKFYKTYYRYISQLFKKEQNEVLIDAVTNGDLDLVKMVLYFGDDIVYSTIDYLIRIAIKNGHLKVLKYLIKYVENVRKHIKDNDDMLNEAAYYGKLDIVKYLVEERRADIEKRIDESNSLALASQEGHMDMIKYMVDERGAKIEDVVLRSTIMGGSLNALKYFVEEKNIKIPSDINELLIELLDDMITTTHRTKKRIMFNDFVNSIRKNNIHIDFKILTKMLLLISDDTINENNDKKLNELDKKRFEVLKYIQKYLMKPFVEYDSGAHWDILKYI